MDLTKQPPRRPSSVSLAGVAGLARMADKAHGHNADLAGEFIYGDDSGLDREVLAFINMQADDFAHSVERLDEMALAALVLERAGRRESEIAAFNTELIEREPQDARHVELLNERVAKYAPGRTDITTVFASIELDDWGAFRDLDLTRRPPRTSYLRSVAGAMGMARMADKARAAKSGRLGDYRYGDDSGQDEALLAFFGLSAGAFMEAAHANPNDAELGEWIAANGTDRSAGDILALNADMAQRGRNGELHERFLARRAEVCPDRGEIQTFFDLMDFDDEHTFGLVDLTRRAPRSPYDATVGGLVGLARMIDKGRAHNGDTLGLYWYGNDSGIDRALLELLGLDQDTFAKGLIDNVDDEAVVEWLDERLAQSQTKIDAFNGTMRAYGPADERGWKFLRGNVGKADRHRSDVQTFLAMTALDDHIFFARLKAPV